MNADPLPTTGVSLHQTIEIVDTNVWKYWTGSAWNTIGTNTLHPVITPPGDVTNNASAKINASINPAAGGINNNVPEANDVHLCATGYGTSAPFVVMESTQMRPSGVIPGQKLFIADTATTLTWNGLTWS